MNTWTDTCDRVIGIKFGDPIVLWHSGNQTGKSYMKVIKNRTYGDISMKPAEFRKVKAWRYSDGSTWHTVVCSKGAAEWIRGHQKELWHENSDLDSWTLGSEFDLHEKLYILTELRWS